MKVRGAIQQLMKYVSFISWLINVVTFFLSFQQMTSSCISSCSGQDMKCYTDTNFAFSCRPRIIGEDNVAGEAVNCTNPDYGDYVWQQCSNAAGGSCESTQVQGCVDYCQDQCQHSPARIILYFIATISVLFGDFPFESVNLDDDPDVFSPGWTDGFLGFAFNFAGAGGGFFLRSALLFNIPALCVYVLCGALGLGVLAFIYTLCTSDGCYERITETFIRMNMFELIFRCTVFMMWLFMLIPFSNPLIASLKANAIITLQGYKTLLISYIAYGASIVSSIYSFKRQ